MDLAQQLVGLKDKLPILLAKLSTFPHDFTGRPAELTGADVLNVVHQVREGSISFQDAVDWANAIETRDDVKIAAKGEIERDRLLQAVFLLSTPEISGLTAEQLLDEVAEVCKEIIDSRS